MRVNRKGNTKPEVLLLNFGTNTNFLSPAHYDADITAKHFCAECNSLVKISYYVFTNVS